MLWLEIVISVAIVFITRDWIAYTFMHDPAAFIVWTALWVITGVSIGRRTSCGQRESKPSYFERKRIERENREREERERIEREENLRRLHRNWVLGFNANMKSFLYELAEADVVEVPLNDDTARKLRNKLTFMGECAIECTNVGTIDGDECWSVRLNDLGKQVVEECSDILEETRDFKVQ